MPSTARVSGRPNTRLSASEGTRLTTSGSEIRRPTASAMNPRVRPNCARMSECSRTSLYSVRSSNACDSVSRRGTTTPVERTVVRTGRTGGVGSVTGVGHVEVSRLPATVWGAAVLHTQQAALQLSRVPPAHRKVLSGNPNDGSSCCARADLDHVPQGNEVAAVDANKTVICPAFFEQCQR